MLATTTEVKTFVSILIFVHWHQNPPQLEQSFFEFARINLRDGDIYYTFDLLELRVSRGCLNTDS